MKYSIEKTAARWYHKRIVKLVKEGKIDEANAFIKTLMSEPKKPTRLQAMTRKAKKRLGLKVEPSQEGKSRLRITPQGTQIKHLGGGAEGVGTLVYGAKDNPFISVRKAYDRGGPLFDKKMLGEKHNIWRRSQAAGDSNLAKMYSKKIRKGKGGTPYTIMEYVRGTETFVPKKAIKNRMTRFAGEQRSLPTAKMRGNATSVKPSAQQEVLLGDTIGNPGNVLTTRKGKQKIIDFIPTTRARIDKFSRGKTRALKKNRKKLDLSTIGSVKNRLTTKGQDQVAKNALDFQEKLMSNPKAMRKAMLMAQSGRTQAGTFKDVFGLNVPPSAFVDGLTRADKIRTLKGL